MTAIAKTGKATAQKYAELLVTALPKPIETEAENERAIEIARDCCRQSAAIAVFIDFLLWLKFILR